MAHKRLKYCIEYEFVKHFCEQWVIVCKDNKLNQSKLLREIGKHRTYVNSIKYGEYNTLIRVYTLQILSDLVGLSVMEVLNYKPKNKIETKISK